MSFFSKYRRVMRFTFLGVVIMSLGLFYMQINTQYEHTVALIKERFREHALNLDYLIKSTTDLVDGMQYEAQKHYVLHQNEPLTGTLAAQIRDNPLSGTFALDTVCAPFTTTDTGNLTGIGSIRGRNPEFYRDVIMALDLNPLFNIGRLNIPNATWFYFTGQERFVNNYPWQPSEKAGFEDKFHDMEFYDLAKPAKNPRHTRFWTKGYVDAWGQGLMVTCSAPVYRDVSFRGTVSTDLVLDFLNEFVRDFAFKGATIFLVNDRDQILAHPTLVSSSDKEFKPIKDAFPGDLKAKCADLFVQNIPLDAVDLGRTLFCYANLKNAPWKLVLLVPDWTLLISVVSESALVVIILLVGLGLMLSVANRLTRREFIVPAEQLVSHIETSSRGESRAIPAVPVSWRPWFDTVTRIFEENRQLLDQMKEQNEHLDALVDARTSELSEKNKELQATLGQLRDAQNQIIMQEKLASLGAMTAGIAHEIKNPLNFVNNFSELTVELAQELREIFGKEKDKLDARNAEDADALISDIEQNAVKIRDHGKRADSIVRNMLQHSRGKTGERHPTDVNALLAEYVNLAYHGLRAQDVNFNITIESSYDPAAGIIDAVPQDLSRVFLNIVNNACYAANEKKTTAGDGFMPTIRVSTKNLNGRVEVRVRDNGNGIPKDVMDKIFNPFFTTKPAGKGTGLGLSISYTIVVEGHNGDIRMETEPGQYTEVIISLPRKAADSSGAPNRQG
ncbi:MAG: ATP-binding protein [bacterium]|nr:ATP-binding protein [Candidatus Sumerlaeota bacterium]